MKALRRRIGEYFIATRPWSFPMSLISVSVGTLLAAEEGPILWGWYGLVAVGAVCFHAAANIFNDYFDTRYGVDQPDSPTARYRPQPLLTGMFTPRQLLAEALFFYFVAVAIGLILSSQRSLIILWIGLIGFLASVFYTAGPIKFKYRAWGELFVFLIWGPLMIEGAYAAQRQALSVQAFHISIPFGTLVALVLLANNIRDIAYDSRQGIKTIGILLGSRQSFVVYAGLILAACSVQAETTLVPPQPTGAGITPGPTQAANIPTAERTSVDPTAASASLSGAVTFNIAPEESKVSI